MISRILWAAALIASLAGNEFLPAMLYGQERPASEADDSPNRFHQQVAPFLKRHCLECHGEDEPQKSFRVDQLTPQDAQGDMRKQWLKVLKRVKAGDMPPASQPRPGLDETEAVIQWLEQNETRLTARHGRAVLRRLNRVEYENTIRDLLGIEVELRDLLPEDGAVGGFDTVGEGQHVSSFLLERYLEAADRALNLAIANTPRPPLVKQRYYCQDTHTVKVATESVYRKQGDATVLFSSSPWNAVTLSPFYPPDRGHYRFRIAAAAVQSQGQPVTLRVEAGPMLMGTKNHLIGYFDALPQTAANPADASPPSGPGTLLEFVDHLEARSTIRLQPVGLATAQLVDKIGADSYEGPGLEVKWIDVEGPLHDVWPPESHRRIFGDLPQEPTPSSNVAHYVEVVSQNPRADAERILRNFTERAFRRAVTEPEITPIVELVVRKQAAGYSFEQAVRVGLKQVLVSPQFLFLHEQPGPLDDSAVASRLSYFLWSTMPDAELMRLAEAGELRDPDTLRSQVERLLASSRASAFTENYVDQWLGLREIDFTEPDRRLYPEYDDLLRSAMMEETHRFFNEVLEQDLSLTNFVASDFTFVNERLARHYNIAGVEGLNFRKVPLTAEHHRGGVLTMASVLKVTANGTNTSPVVRGSWVLSRILGTPPEPPPAEVSAIEPDIRGATTIREQLAKHRENEACASCHIEMDPLGFALESYDVIGLWRGHYRSVGNGIPVVIEGKTMPYLQGPAVDPSDTLADGRKFADIDELKMLLVADQDKLARALTGKLITYATGCVPTPADQAEVERIVAQVRRQDYGFRTLIHEIVQSKLFLEK